MTTRTISELHDRLIREVMGPVIEANFQVRISDIWDGNVVRQDAPIEPVVDMVLDLLLSSYNVSTPRRLAILTKPEQAAKIGAYKAELDRIRLFLVSLIDALTAEESALNAP